MALAALVLASALPTPVAAQGGPRMAERWTYSLTPYFWLPGVDAQLRYGPPPPGGSVANVGIDSEGILEKLNMAFMLQGEARKGQFFLGGDLIVLDFGDEASVVRSVDFNPGSGPINIGTGQLDAGTRTSLDAVVVNAVAGRNLKHDATATLDVFAGLRYARIDTRTEWHLAADVTGPPGTATFARNGSIERSVDLWDGIIGARGRVGLGDSQGGSPMVRAVPRRPRRGLVELHLARRRRHRLRLQLGRPRAVLPLPVLRRGRRQVRPEAGIRRIRDRRALHVLNVHPTSAAHR